MPKLAKELSALEVSRLSDKGKYPVGRGIYLEISATGAKAWVLRITVGNKRRHIGLGSYPTISLALAREKALLMRDQINQGLDPVEQKKAVRSALKAQQAKEVTFKQCALAYIDAHSDGWKNKRTHENWPRSFEMYAYPAIGGMLVRDIEQAHILQIIEPLWKEKTETAKRLRNRLEQVLDYATARHYRTGENPARWKNKLDKILPSPSKIAKVKHHEAIAIDAIPEFMQALQKRIGMGRYCLEFLILTACRSGEARGATWDEVDFENKLWSIPRERMKSNQPHQVPLSDQAIALLQEIPKTNSPYIFFSATGGMLSDMTLSSLMRKMDAAKTATGKTAVPHGFRSTFRDWAGDKTSYPRELAEAALAHALLNKVEAAYRRSTALEKRREMMQEWANYCYK